jgi:hypothetical protein
MHRPEPTLCADCGAPMLAGGEDGFGFGERSMLCASYATRRGGSYDARPECWLPAPRAALSVDEPR